MIAQLDKAYIHTRPAKLMDRLVSYALFEGRPLTTAGRWINKLVFLSYAAQKKLPQFKKVEKPVFILGTGRSGTTLLGMLLGMHFKTGFLNEPKALWHSLFPYEDIVGNYTDNVAFYRLNASMAEASIVRDAHRMYGFYLWLLGKDRVVDKYPELIFRINFVKAIFPDARFILLIRDGYDTCVSIDAWSQTNGRTANHVTEDWWGKNQKKWNLLLDEVVKNDAQLRPSYDDLKQVNDHKNMAALEWCLTMKEGSKLLKDPAHDILPVKYETLTHHPEETLNTLLDYMDLPPDPKMIAYAKKVVRPVARKEKFDVHPKLQPLFHEMMEAFGYAD